MDHNAVTPMRLEPAAPQSRVKHSTTEPLHSHSFNPEFRYNPENFHPSVIPCCFWTSWHERRTKPSSIFASAHPTTYIQEAFTLKVLASSLEWKNIYIWNRGSYTSGCLTLYFIETLNDMRGSGKIDLLNYLINPLPQRDSFKHFCKQSSPRSGSSCKSCLIRVYTVCLWKYIEDIQTFC